MKPEIIIGNYEQLKNECNLIRYAVFVEEQKVPENLEIDDRDPLCYHLILKLDKKTIATARIDLEKKGKIGRLAILKNFRRQGYGTLIIKNLEKIASDNDLKSVWLNAQKNSLSFYQKLNYHIVSEEFMEANIPHLTMLKNI